MRTLAQREEQVHAARGPQQRYPPRPARTRVERVIEEEPYDEESPEHEVFTAPAWFAVSRGTAFFVGAVMLLTLFNELQFPQFEGSAWWLDLRPLPKPIGRGFLALTAVLLLIFWIAPRINGLIRRLTCLCALALLGAAIWNAYRHYHALPGGQRPPEIPIPFACHIAAMLVVILPGLFTAGRWERFRYVSDFLYGAWAIALCIAAFPLAQFFCAGKIDHRQAADAIVIFADQEANSATDPAVLEERIRTGCTLYRDGLARKMVCAVELREPADKPADALRRRVIEQKVSEVDILANVADAKLDAAVAATARTLQEKNLARVLVVGPFYQLPRIKLDYERAGIQASTVPSAESLRLKAQSIPVVREMAAFWLAFVQPLAR
jgi:hypothetical protein